VATLARDVFLWREMLGCYGDSGVEEISAVEVLMFETHKPLLDGWLANDTVVSAIGRDAARL